MLGVKTMAKEKRRQTADGRRRRTAVLRMVGWVILLTYFPVALFFVSRARAQARCDKIVTNVHNDGCNVLMTSESLLKLVKRDHPELVGSLLKDVNYAELEAAVEKLPCVRKCEAYPTMGGAVHVEIYQRAPIMRVFCGGGSYYMDEHGYKITATSAMRTHILVVNGSVNAMLDHSDLISLCAFINQDDFWRAMIEQVYVTGGHEFVLVPRVGNHVVEFGSVDGMRRKFDDLRALYRHGWEKLEWNVYKKVSLKYEGQIVCTRR